MTKDEARLSVMGAISMALKGPTLQQGFEIICKNLSKLEKENEKLEKRCDNYEETLSKMEKVACDICKETAKDRELEELKKENAELKEKFLKVKKDDVRKSKLNSFKTFEEKNEYLRQVATYALFNEDIGVMLWCFMQRDNIYKDINADLEKENAELRTKTTALENANKAMVKELDDMTSGELSVLENVVRSTDQLTKAKELIEDMYDRIPASHSDYYKDVMERAKQFLKEE